MAEELDLPSRELLTESARQVLRRARQLESGGELRARALISALLEDSDAARLLSSVYVGLREDLQVLEPRGDFEELSRRAYEVARECGRMEASPAHLLIAAVAASPRIAEFEEAGLTVNRLKGAAWSRHGSGPKLPAAVSLAAFSLLVQGGCCGCSSLFVLMGPVGLSGIPIFLLLVWNAVLSLVLAVSLNTGSGTRIWSTACAYQLAQTASLLAATAGSGGRGIGGAVAAIVVGVTFAALFRSRGWFGVPEREKWRTLWRQGGWALVITWALNLWTLAGAYFGGGG